MTVLAELPPGLGQPGGVCLSGDGGNLGGSRTNGRTLMMGMTPARERNFAHRRSSVHPVHARNVVDLMAKSTATVCPLSLPLVDALSLAACWLFPGNFPHELS
jgi:hypothetical protein